MMLASYLLASADVILDLTIWAVGSSFEVSRCAYTGNEGLSLASGSQEAPQAKRLFS